MSISTPCRAACQSHGGICLGCQRTLEEIMTWKDKTEAERLDIMTKIKPQTEQRADIKPTQASCAHCQQPMHCDISAGKTTCWCFELERREIPAPLQNQNACLCRHCLSKLPLAT
ncbi:cysteine-rich CWC family protein [Vibrio sp. HB161653]|uniref:cysteine-rich CWC family protein n=1 Tax=Vibrio sp. HB161653 TaxID=3068274 RepID=UPI003530A62E